VIRRARNVCGGFNDDGGIGNFGNVNDCGGFDDFDNDGSHGILDARPAAAALRAPLLSSPPLSSPLRRPGQPAPSLISVSFFVITLVCCIKRTLQNSGRPGGPVHRRG